MFQNKKKKCKSYLWPLLLLQPSYPSCKCNNNYWNAATFNKINNRIYVKITCRIFDPSLNNKTTVNDANHTKGFIFKIIDSLMKYMGVWKPVISIQSCFNTSRLDTNSSSEISQNVRSLQEKFAIKQEKHFGWIFFIL